METLYQIWKSLIIHQFTSSFRFKSIYCKLYKTFFTFLSL